MTVKGDMPFDQLDPPPQFCKRILPWGFHMKQQSSILWCLKHRVFLKRDRFGRMMVQPILMSCIDPAQPSLANQNPLWGSAGPGNETVLRELTQNEPHLSLQMLRLGGQQVAENVGGAGGRGQGRRGKAGR